MTDEDMREDVCRRLFPDDDDTCPQLSTRDPTSIREEMEALLEQVGIRWNFDFKAEQPLPGRFAWTRNEKLRFKNAAQSISHEAPSYCNKNQSETRNVTYARGHIKARFHGLSNQTKLSTVTSKKQGHLLRSHPYSQTSAFTSPTKLRRKTTEDKRSEDICCTFKPITNSVRIINNSTHPTSPADQNDSYIAKLCLRLHAQRQYAREMRERLFSMDVHGPHGDMEHELSPATRLVSVQVQTDDTQPIKAKAVARSLVF